MAVDYDAIKSTMAQNIADAIASASSDSMATLAVASTGITATWSGSATVLVPDTSLLAVGNYIKVNSDNNWYKILSIVPDVNVIIEDTYDIGSFPSGGDPITLSATLTWDGTPIVLASSTSELIVGDSIRLNSDGEWFFVAVIDPDTSVTILPKGLTIPTGSTSSSKAGSSFTDVKLPGPPEGDSLVDKIGDPIAIPVVDDGIKVVQQQPHELPNFTVIGAGSISSPATGSTIYVTNDVGGSVPAFYDGTSWRRVTDRAIISVI